MNLALWACQHRRSLILLLLVAAKSTKETAGGKEYVPNLSGTPDALQRQFVVRGNAPAPSGDYEVWRQD
jgi:hypothetical protein